MSARVPILCYHRVHADDDPSTPAVVPGEYCGHVTASVFARQMRMLADGGFKVVTHRELMGWLLDGETLPDAPVAAIDFDDNRLNVFENAFPIMREFGFRGTAFVVSALAEGKLPHMQSYPWMDWTDLAILKDSGWTVGAHTVSHLPLGKLFDEQGAEAVEREMIGCAEMIKRRLGIDAPNFAYPQGDWREEVEQIVKRHCRTARHWNPEGLVEYNTTRTNPHRLQAINISMRVTDEQFRGILAQSREQRAEST